MGTKMAGAVGGIMMPMVMSRIFGGKGGGRRDAGCRFGSAVDLERQDTTTSLLILSRQQLHHAMGSHFVFRVHTYHEGVAGVVRIGLGCGGKQQVLLLSMRRFNETKTRKIETLCALSQ